jgi:hypothetical protein
VNEKKDIIELARIEFSNKEFKKCLALYETSEPELLNELDQKIIQFCMRALEEPKGFNDQNLTASAN